jgi:hypothetical protein
MDVESSGGFTRRYTASKPGGVHRAPRAGTDTRQRPGEVGRVVYREHLSHVVMMLIAREMMDATSENNGRSRQF